MQIRKFLYFLPLAFLISATGCTSWYENTHPTRSVVPNPQQVSVVQPMPNRTGREITPSEVVYRSISEQEYNHQPTKQRTKKRRSITPRRASRADDTIVAMPGSERTNQILATHQTEINAKEKSRNTNITLAANSINGKIVQPGEIFSFNETVGPTIKSRGYKKGMIYIDGKKSEGFGGGVCQVSSTLHMAAKQAGMTIIERHDHSLPVGYAKSGEEAATSYGSIDFRFRNDKPHPIIIHSGVVDGVVRAELRSM